MITISRYTRKLLLSKNVADNYIGYVKCLPYSPDDKELMELLSSKYLERRILGIICLGDRSRKSAESFISSVSSHIYKVPEGEMKYIKLENTFPPFLFVINNEFILLVAEGNLAIYLGDYLLEVPHINLKTN